MRYVGLLVAGFGNMVSGVCAGAIVPDPMFRANFEPPPDCTSVGASGCPGFQISAPPISILAGQAISYCFYFQTPNAGTSGVARFSATFDRSVTQNIVVYATYDTTSQLPAPREAPGTLAMSGCGSGNSNNTYARRLYSTHSAGEELRMPQDDGAGTPLAIELPANSPGFIEMYFVNASETPLASQVTLYANTLADATAYVKTATYMTYYGSLSIPAMTTNYSVSQTCAVPASVKFWWLSTHTHSRATDASLRDGAATLVSSSDWQAPAIASYGPPFYTFSQGLTYSCTYDNFSNAVISAGDSYATDENCVGIGYFFPATSPLICYNQVGPF